MLLSAGQQEADELIETLIGQHSSVKHLVVVSNDHRLQSAARREGAQPMSCTEFLDFLERRAHSRLSRAEESEKKEELSEKEIKAWLEEFAGLEEEPDLKEAFERYDFEKD